MRITQSKLQNPRIENFNLLFGSVLPLRAVFSTSHETWDHPSGCMITPQCNLKPSPPLCLPPDGSQQWGASSRSMEPSIKLLCWPSLSLSLSFSPMLTWSSFHLAFGCQSDEGECLIWFYLPNIEWESSKSVWIIISRLIKLGKNWKTLYFSYTRLCVWVVAFRKGKK